MSEAYCQKLLNWWCSMAGLALVAFAALLIAWLDAVNAASRSALDIVYWTLVIDPASRIFSAGFTILAAWHMFDFAQKANPHSELARLVGNYRTIAAVLGLMALLLLGKTMGAFDTLRCFSPPVEFWCHEGVSLWLEVPFKILLLFACILCMGKAVISVRSRFKKAP